MAALPPAALAFQKAHIKENRGPLVIGVSATLIALVTAAVLMRFLGRRVRQLPLLSDDWLTIPAWFFVSMLCVTNFLCVHYGVGKHLIAINPATAYEILHVGFFNSLCYVFAHLFIKFSILLFYRRVFTTQKKWFRWVTYALMAYVAAWALACFILVMAQCRPVSYFWLRLSPTPISGMCSVGTSASDTSTSVFNTFADFALLILPMFVLWNLQLPFNRKIGLIAIFLVGALACAAGLVRIWSTVNALGNETDTSWTTAEPLTWTAIEAGVGLVCACFPVMAPLFGQFFRESVGIAKSGGSNKKSHSSKGSKGSKSSKSSSIFRRFTVGQSHDSYVKQDGDDKIPLHNISWPLEIPRATAVGIEGENGVPEAARRVMDQDRGRREQLHPGLQDPRVINEVYRGVSPGEMGMDENGKPLPSNGILVKNDLEWTAEATNCPPSTL